MKNFYLILVAITIILIIVLAVKKYEILDILIDCEKEDVRETQSTNKNFKAIIFIENCNHALTDFSTNIAILPNDKDTSDLDKEDIILRVKSWQEIDIKWTGEKELHIEYDKTPKVYTYTKIEEFKGIKIIYTQREEGPYKIWE